MPPSVKTSLIIEAKDMASAIFSTVFAKVNKEMGTTASAAIKLEEALNRSAASYRKNADAAANAGNPELAKFWNDQANAADRMAASVDVVGNAIRKSTAEQEAAAQKIIAIREKEMAAAEKKAATDAAAAEKQAIAETNAIAAAEKRAMAEIKAGMAAEAAAQKQAAAEATLTAEKDRLNASLDKSVQKMGASADVSKVMADAYRRLAAEERVAAQEALKLGDATQVQKHLDAAKAFDQQSESVKAASQQFKLFGMNIVDIAAKFYLLQTGMRFVYEKIIQLFKLAELGAKVEQASISFEMLSANLGLQADLMDRLREASRGLMTDYELQNKVAGALSGTQGQLAKEFADALPSILQYAIAAKTLKPEIESIDTVYNKLILGIRRGSPRLIDDANIVIKVGEAYANYRKELGLATDAELTAEQQQIAVLHEMQRAGDVLLEQAGIVGALTDRYGKLKTELENTKQAGGVFLNEFLAPSIDLINEQLGAVDKTSDRWATLGRILSIIPTAITNAYIAFEKFQFQLLANINYIDEEAKGLIYLDERFGLFGGKMKGATDAIQSFVAGLEDVPPVAEAGADAANKFGDAWHNALTRLAGEQASLNKKLKDASLDYQSKILKETQSLEDKLTDIHDQAGQKRLDLSKSISEQEISLAESYNEKRADLERQLAELRSGGPGATQAERQKSYLESLLNMSREDLERFLNGGVYQSRVDEWVSLTQEQVTRLEQQIADEQKQTQIQELEQRLSLLDREYEAELSKLQQQSASKLAIITKEEEDATAKANEESSKRLRGWQDDLIELNKSIQETYKENWLEALLSVTEKGSALNKMLEDQRLKVMGLSNEMISFYKALEDYVQNPLQLAILAARLGLIDYTEIPLPIPAGAHPGRQHGGSVTSGQGYIVGEAGPELFMPKSSGTIIPNNALGGGMNVSISAGAFLGSRADAIRLGNELAPIIARSLKAHGIQIQ